MAEHKFIKPDSIESRVYQETILNTIVKHNTLVVLPTGLGKTYIAALLAAKRVEDFPSKLILFLAPTKPLVEQHCSTWQGTFNFDADEFQVFTGQTLPEVRKKMYKDPQFIFATPQVIQNDIVTGRFPLETVSLIIFDEAHRAVGEYPYGFIASKFVNTSKNPRILALTASPGSKQWEIERICKELFIEKIESRDRTDPEVKAYVKKREFEWVKIDLPREFLKIKSLLEVVMKEYLRYLKKGNIIKTEAVAFVRKKQLLMLQSELVKKAAHDKDYYKYVSIVAALLKIYHGLELLETQGIVQLCAYFDKLKKDRTMAASNLFLNKDFAGAVASTGQLKKEKMEHPKLSKLIDILSKKKKSIVFAHYRSSVENIIKELEKNKISAISLVGQARGEEGGLSQKEQVRRLKEFRRDAYLVLVATSIGEEGLDIPEVEQVIFYEPVPSAIRSIQRAGRTARHKPGKVYILMTKGTRDEAYYWSSFYKERSMGKALKGVKLKKAQKTLDKFASESEKPEEEPQKVIVFVDTRETGSGIVKELSNLGVDIRLEKRQVADFQLSDRVGVERKTVEDFTKSLADGRLLSQAQEMVGNFERPVLIVEGDDLYGAGNVHPNAIKGALAALSVDFKIPIIRTKDYKETAAFLELIARREQFELKREIRLRGEKKPKTPAELQQFIIESLPNVGPTLAKNLLKHFGSVEEIFTASETELMKVPMVGEKKAKDIVKIINHGYE